MNENNKTILGLDLGVSSIGHALIEVDDNGNPIRILEMGSRIVPLRDKEGMEFTNGKSATVNAERTQSRQLRRGYARKRQRRDMLRARLADLGMLPDESLMRAPLDKLWGLRAKAVSFEVSLPELGRILLHIEHRRGYNHETLAETTGKEGEWVQAISDRYDEIRALGRTVGEHMWAKLAGSATAGINGKPFYTFRVKENIYPREAYKEEYDKIMACQQRFHPETLTDEVVKELRDRVIFYQRALKSCKDLVSRCEFSLRTYRDKDGKEILSGPRVAPKSSPLAQTCKILEEVNNIVLTNRRGERYAFTPEERSRMYAFLNTHEKMGVKDMFSLLGLSKRDGWYGGKAIGRGLQGNTTRNAIAAILAGTKWEGLLRFDLAVKDSANIETGEVCQVLSESLTEEPLYVLWHLIYSIKEKGKDRGKKLTDFRKSLYNTFGVDDPAVAERLYDLDFVKAGYANKSVRFMRRIIPFLQRGMMYSDACEAVGQRHSGWMTKEENQTRELAAGLEPLSRNSLRQPTVEKVLNQMIRIVNETITRHGRPDEIRVELARELKQSREERDQASKRNYAHEKENAKTAKKIEELGMKPTKSKIMKYKLWQETGMRCVYCGKVIDVKNFLSGSESEIEHIIPRSLFFDDSFANKTCACASCNHEKANKTAYDYMASKGQDALDRYLLFVEELATRKGNPISNTKRSRLLTSEKDIPQDFIDRSLRQTQYISKKALDILRNVCRDVTASSGTVTDYLRHIWGYDTILHDLNLDLFHEAGMTETVEADYAGQVVRKEKIKDWSKRIDNRHHAIDALVVALTRQSYIQRLNTLNASRSEMQKEAMDSKVRGSLLEKWVAGRPHFNREDVIAAVERIIVKRKAGKKVATRGKRYVKKGGRRTLVQQGILTPRGALFDASIYGVMKIKSQTSLKKAFGNPDSIVSARIRKQVQDRLQANGGDIVKAVASLKKNPVTINNEPLTISSKVHVWDTAFVKRRPLSSLKKKEDAAKIVDEGIRRLVEERFDQVGNKNPFAEPLYLDKDRKIEVRAVCMYTGLADLDPIKSLNGKVTGYAKPNNNHHVAIYKDADGSLVEHVVTFRAAVDRMRAGIPVVIEDTDEAWARVDADAAIPEGVKAKLPPRGLKLYLQFQIGQMWILGMSAEEYAEAVKNDDQATINKHLYRVVRLSSLFYVFALHNLTGIVDDNNTLKAKICYRIQSIGILQNYNPIYYNRCL